MTALRQILRHPAGRVGMVIGLTAGLIAALMGESRKALLCVGFIAFWQYRLSI